MSKLQDPSKENQDKNTPKAGIIKKVVDPKYQLQIKIWFVRRVYKMCREFGYC